MIQSLLPTHAPLPIPPSFIILLCLSLTRLVNETFWTLGSSAIKIALLGRHKELHKHLLDTCCVPGTLPGPGNRNMNRLSGCLWGDQHVNKQTTWQCSGSCNRGEAQWHESKGAESTGRAQEGFTEEETILERSFIGCKAQQKCKVCKYYCSEK